MRYCFFARQNEKENAEGLFCKIQHFKRYFVLIRTTFLQRNETKAGHCFIHCYSVSENILLNLKLGKPQKVGEGGEYKIRYMVCALDSEHMEAFIYAEFDQIRVNLLTKILRNTGATQISVESFSREDYCTGPGKALGLVLSKIEQGLNKIERGSTKVVPTYDVNDLQEFDVVKKRRMMDQAPGDDSTDCPAALQRFKDFEAHVLPALLKIDAEDKQTRHDDMLQMELDLCSGVRSIALAGGVYVAVSKAVKFPKIGATRKGDPTQRLQTLSRHVPSPFEAIYWVPTVMPFKVESEIHLHFDAFRLREKGACTEFFDVDVRVIGEYLKANYAVVETGAL